MLAVDIPVVFLRSSLSWSTFLNTSLNFSVTNSQRAIDVTAFSRHTANLKHTEKTLCEVWKCGTSLLIRKNPTKTWNIHSLFPRFYSLVCGLKLPCLRTAKFAQMERLGAFFVKKTKGGLKQAPEVPQMKDPKVMVCGCSINITSSWQLDNSWDCQQKLWYQW